jgi:hypothetical protein
MAAHWSEYQGNVTGGTIVQGDKTVPRTRRWNVRFLRRFVWKRVTIFQVPPGSVYRVGFIPFEGPAQLCEQRLTALRFAVRNGYEDCTFFALDEQGRTLPISFLQTTHVRNLSSEVVLV